MEEYWVYNEDAREGKFTFDDGRFINLSGADAVDFNESWKAAKSSTEIDGLKTSLIRSKHSVHYPPKR